MGDGIGIFGVIIAILIVLTMRGCVITEHQNDVNDFCINKTFDYGAEIIKNTVIKCYVLDNDNTTNFPYREFSEFKFGDKDE